MNDIKTTIKPFLTVQDGIKAIEFYKSAFGAIETKRFELENQKIFSVIEIESAVFYLSDEERCNGNLKPDIKSNSPIRIILETKNADEIFEKALKFGAKEICPIKTEEDWRIGKLKDPFGHVWEIGYIL
ncbi:VOC family protein [Flavobacterium sp. MR2016-29]|uniref:VOC family protein n=1 Tax=Flavobacterium sp. MR2016-29 TaxID=2783795 RepID=UPI00188CD9C5|nr:VOC family protein [Flavobacterium sp. MR2016-29]MBF4491003.1 VOC family protein [Flavobacterium sp. MR2016-29]